MHSAKGEEEEFDLKDALVDAPIIGVEQSTTEELKTSAATPVRSPKPVTLAEKEKHDITHTPLHPGCPMCASSMTPHLKHGPSHEHLRAIPLLVRDYCFMRRADER